jgi:hypothetical protein
MIENLSLNKHIFFTTYSTKIYFSTVTHLMTHEKEAIWGALLVTYNMYLRRGFRITVISGDQEFAITVISGDQEFAALNELTTVLPTAPLLNWTAASQHCGLIERNICFLKEKIHLVRHSLPFTTVLGIMVVVHMVLHIIKFVNGFPCRSGVKHFSPGEIMTDCHIHNSNITLSFGVYCQFAETVQPQNSLTLRTKAAILLGGSGNLLVVRSFLLWIPVTLLSDISG